jgi:hypothetical protein
VVVSVYLPFRLSLVCEGCLTAFDKRFRKRGDPKKLCFVTRIVAVKIGCWLCGVF